MKYDVILTEQAEIDRRCIFEYIAFELLAPENAAGQLDRIEEKILSLMRSICSTHRRFYQKEYDSCRNGRHNLSTVCV